MTGIDAVFFNSGACAVGIAPIGETPSGIMRAFDDWIAGGNLAGMDYLAKHRHIRLNPQELLPRTRTIISLAFPYSPATFRNKSLPAIASYAYGADYHDVIKTRLKRVTTILGNIYGGDYRICVDSAPIFERFWAQLTGIGVRSDNGLIAVPGYGTRVFLAEILATVDFPASTFIKPVPENDGLPDSTGEPCHRPQRPASIAAPDSCIHCGACRLACPAGALQPDSSVDARRCLSYLTIEHRGDWDPLGEKCMSTPAGRHTLFGCDICQQVCPMNAPLNPGIPSTGIEEFRPLPGILTLSASQAKAMTQQEFSSLFKGSPIKRAKLAGFLRDARNLSDS